MTLLLALSSCGEADQRLIEGVWLLDSVAVDGMFLTLDPALSAENGRGVTAWFDFGTDGDFSGKGPCNDVTGKYSFDAESLSVSNVAQSEVFCISPTLSEQALMDTERLVFDTLFDTPEVHFSSDIRMQWQTEHTTLTFRRAS